MVRIFISYAHDDDTDNANSYEVFSKGLKKHLGKKFDIWDDTAILPGLNWDDEIQNRLAACDMAILCVSASFLDSDYIEAHELGKLLSQYPEKVVVPVYFNHCNFQAWEQLAKKQFYKPSGSKYGKGGDDDFAFCDLIQYTEVGGSKKILTTAEMERYFKEFAFRLEAMIPAAGTAATSVASIASQKNVYINELNYPYFEKKRFFGRQELLKEIDTQLKELDIPLLLSGIGGMGKTAIAIAYGQLPEYAAFYNNIAWVNVTGDLFSSLFSTFEGNPVLKFTYDSKGNRQNDIDSIMLLLKNTPGNNLLLIDNVNNEDDVKLFINYWKSYKPAWKCIVTTRIDNKEYNDHILRLHALTPDAAEKLYRYNFQEDEFDREAFLKLYKYIDGHTFLVELLAKYAEANSTVKDTAGLLKEIVAKGITSLGSMVAAKQGQQQSQDKKVSEFVLGLYDPTVLPETEKSYMRYFSVLPSQETDFEKLVTLFGIEPGDQADFDNTLRSLAKSGWLMYNKKTFKCHQIIAEICREKLKPTALNCAQLINSLSELFKEHNLKKSLPYFETASSILSYITESTNRYALVLLNFADLSISAGVLAPVTDLFKQSRAICKELNDTHNEAVCLERIGDVYIIYGNNELAASCYEEYNELAKSIAEKSPKDWSGNLTLAISYFKLGKVYIAQKQVETALEKFEKTKEIALAVLKTMPENISFKNILAGAYSRIGDIHIQSTEAEKALEVYQKFNELSEALVKESPGNEEFKKNLSISYRGMGEVCLLKEDKAGAREWFDKYHSSRKKLADDQPENVDFQHGVAVSLTKLAQVTDDEERQVHLSEARHIWESLVAKVPGSVAYKDSLDWVNKVIGQG